MQWSTAACVHLCVWGCARVSVCMHASLACACPCICVCAHVHVYGGWDVSPPMRWVDKRRARSASPFFEVLVRPQGMEVPRSRSSWRPSWRRIEAGGRAAKSYAQGLVLGMRYILQSSTLIFCKVSNIRAIPNSFAMPEKLGPGDAHWYPRHWAQRR